MQNKNKYQLETLYLAVSLADRYLIHLTMLKMKAPCLVSLAATCLMIAAKLTLPHKPKFAILNNVLESHYEVSMKKSVFHELECSILVSLQFEINFVSPILFLERF